VEFGVGGGGIAGDGSLKIPARTPLEASKSLYLGTSDPKKNPWSTEALRTFRFEAYSAFCDFLKRPLGRHPVQAAFTWNAGSWDVNGIENSNFAAPEIIKMLKSHNSGN
jgi:hypothetical protein